jgi:hypothetical protein
VNEVRLEAEWYEKAIKLLFKNRHNARMKEKDYYSAMIRILEIAQGGSPVCLVCYNGSEDGEDIPGGTQTALKTEGGT